ncbi:hypothetical protein BMS3Bbin08_01908 [bacterium BMS3Bbin08]|nr:hypothetical protein BMS3Bbin08_01908 [bacterium BMS3Bbin08]
MSRVPQQSGERGSLRHIQELINNRPALLNKLIKEKIHIKSDNIEWVSPLADDEYAEYRDDDFIKRLGIPGLKIPLHDFWPNKGPQWDALGQGNDGEVFLVEAKANIPELLSSCGARSPKSRKRIQRRLKETREFLKCRTEIDWTTGLYQYANRLAHLYYLRHLNKIKAYLIFVYFLDDTTHIPTSLEQWTGALQLEKKLLGLSKHKLSRYIADVFIDVGEMLRYKT